MEMSYIISMWNPNKTILENWWRTTRLGNKIYSTFYVI